VRVTLEKGEIDASVTRTLGTPGTQER
jgi:hypothetical protein